LIDKRAYLVLALLLVVLGISLTLINPSLFTDNVASASDQNAASINHQVVQANTEFALNLFKELTKEDNGNNVIVSPLSISTALTMVYDGAEGSTKDAMSRTLGVESISLDLLKESNLNLLQSLQGVDDAIQLKIADSIWIRDTFEKTLNQNYRNDITRYFLSDVYTRRFDGATVSEVNNWVSEKTQQKIQNLLKIINPNDALILVNTIYFKGNWTVSFDASRTHAGGFALSNGKWVMVDYMYCTHGFGFLNSSSCQAVRLPYGEDKVAMYIFLPSGDVSMESFVAGLSQGKLDSFFSGFHNTSLAVKLPKFSTAYGVKELETTLSNMGMGVAFDSANADFTGISSVPLFVSSVAHKSFVSVDEFSTEAAAATDVVGTYGVPPRFTGFDVDRPFFFMIRDDHSGSILFMGLVENPLQSVSP
jgi:serpin B